MMKYTLKYKYFFGTHIMFYEIDLVPEYVNSIINALDDIENKENITVELCLNLSQYFEKYLNTNSQELVEKFHKAVEKLEALDLYVKLEYYTDDEPYTMTDYRREINDKCCNDYDYIIWGETDCLLPKSTFKHLDEIKDITKSYGIHKYITTFAVRKMWDDSWRVLEHTEFKDKKYYEKSESLAFTERHSIRTVWTQNELDEFNSKYETDPEYLITDQPKFDGSLLCISSDLIKAGCNIPRGVIGLSGEDTAFMVSCMKIMGKQYRQIIVNNILKIHNREHPNKRKYCTLKDGHISTQDNKGDRYKKIRDLSKHNLSVYQNFSQERFLTWEDFNN